MSLALTIARRELRGGLRGFRVFLACLALGVAAIAAVGMVRAAIQAGLTEQANSWVSTGQNLPISGNQLEAALETGLTGYTYLQET